MCLFQISTLKWPSSWGKCVNIEYNTHDLAVVCHFYRSSLRSLVEHFIQLSIITFQVDIAAIMTMIDRFLNGKKERIHTNEQESNRKKNN